MEILVGVEDKIVEDKVVENNIVVEILVEVEDKIVEDKIVEVAENKLVEMAEYMVSVEVVKCFVLKKNLLINFEYPNLINLVQIFLEDS